MVKMLASNLFSCGCAGGFVLERQTMTKICASLKAQGNDLLPTGWKLLDTAIANEITFDAAKKLPYYQLVLVHEHDAFG